MTDPSTDATGTIIPFPVGRIDREEIVAESPSVYFDVIVTFGEKRKIVASSAMANADDIHRSVVYELAELYSLLTEVVEILDVEGRSPALSIEMILAHEQTTDVGPAISQLSFISQFSSRDRRSPERFPKKITSELLNALARSHFAVIGKEMAQAELAAATELLNRAMISHGMIQPGES